MTTKETSSYIKGLMDGAELNKNTPEGKIIAALVELCDKMAGEIETLRDELDVANDYIEEIDEDLGAVEELLYDDDADEDDDEDDEGCTGDCETCGGCDLDDDEDEEEDDDEEEFYCAMCPNCGGKVYFDDTVNPEDVICPNCQKPLISDEDELDEEEDV